MKFKTAISASILAVALVACGSGDDASKPDDGKTNLPPKPQACIDAGDQCKWDGKEWVVSKPNDGEKPSNDEPPVADTSFDYSDIGVTDTLEPEKRGFGFWNKGVDSPLNAKSFKNNPTQSPIIQWSSKLNYDEDLYNFVAITLDTQDKDTKNKPKFMFDKIGEKNQEKNKNFDFFGKAAQAALPTSGGKLTAAYAIGNSSFTKSSSSYVWNTVPALVNSFMYRNNLGGWTVHYVDSIKKAFLNQEEETTSTVGSGHTSLRVYGVNAFLFTDDSTAKTNMITPKGEAYGTTLSDSDHYKLPTRTDKKYIKHANFAWYKLSTKADRVAKATVTGGTTVVPVTTTYADSANHPFPTDNELDELIYTQFGRLTGEGIDPEAEKIAGYKDELLKPYNFTEGDSAVGGNKKAEDWYFARGTEPAPLATLDGLKAAGKEIVYDGQAVMFGIDYDPRKVIKGEDAKNDQSTNSVKPIDSYSKAHTLLDGKQNFVRLTWNPASGEVNGSVYGVWTKATYYRANQNIGTKIKAGNAIKLGINSDKKLDADTSAATGDHVVMGPTSDIATIAAAQGVLAQSIRVEPYINHLVLLKGQVVEGTNSFGGSAVRVKDESKGLFHGAFFGRDASEVGGVINSQSGSFKDENLIDPAAKWGGAFGAKNQKTESPEDLIFEDKTYDYGTSTEFFTNNQ